MSFVKIVFNIPNVVEDREIERFRQIDSILVSYLKSEMHMFLLLLLKEKKKKKKKHEIINRNRSCYKIDEGNGMDDLKMGNVNYLGASKCDTH